MKFALTPAHFLANIVDPKYTGNQLKDTEVDSALEYCNTEHPTCLPTVINFRAKSGPFKPYLFNQGLVQNVTALAWWQSQSDRISSDMLGVCTQLMTAVASSAGVERVFSTFGLVHTKLRNRLGTEKAGKLVFIYKLLNGKK